MEKISLPVNAKLVKQGYYQQVQVQVSRSRQKMSSSVASCQQTLQVTSHETYITRTPAAGLDSGPEKQVKDHNPSTITPGPGSQQKDKDQDPREQVQNQDPRSRTRTTAAGLAWLSIATYQASRDVTLVPLQSAGVVVPGEGQRTLRSDKLLLDSLW